MIELILLSEKRLHKEQHQHACPVHARGRCRHASASTVCNNCLFTESNEVCGKTLRGTNLDFHHFPCMQCNMTWRSQWGGETLVGGLIELEQMARLAHVAPSSTIDDREENEADSNPEVRSIVDARKRL